MLPTTLSEVTGPLFGHDRLQANDHDLTRQGNGEPIGELEDEEWLEIVVAVDAEIGKVLAAGVFELRHEERYSVVHEFGTGRECLDVVAGWAGTNVPEDVGALLEGGNARIG